MTSVITNKTSNSDSDDIDLGRIFGEILDHRKLIIATTTVFTALVIIYVLFATPIYQADALVQVEQKQGNALLDSINQVLPSTQPQSVPEIVLLQSRMILGKTVDDLGLQTIVKENYFPIFGEGWDRLTNKKPANILLTKFKINESDPGNNTVKLTILDKNNYRVEGDNFSFSAAKGVLTEKYGVSILVSDTNAVPGTSFTITQLSRLAAINKLQQVFTVTDEGKNTGMLTLTVMDEDKLLAKKILNTITQNYLAQNISRQAAQNEKSLEFLSQQLPKVRNDLDKAEDKLNFYRRQKDSVDLSLEAKSVLDQIVNVDNQLNELTFREAEVSQLYTKEHPTYKSLVEKRKILQNEKAQLSKRVSSMPATQQEVLRLSRDVESGRAVYMQLLNRQQELNIAKSSAIGNVRIIDDAVTLPRPVSPQKLILVLVGIVAGLFISLGLIVVKTFLRKGIESPEQLEEIGINVYASIPVSENHDKASKYKGAYGFGKIKETYSFLAIENPADLAIEAVRGLRTSLHFAMMESENNVLMISGASPNAGKTFVSSNLAAIIAQTDRKVLFIDADMRKGYVHKVFGSDNDKGLSEVLSGQVDVNKVVKTVESAGFDFISRGNIPPNPAELLMNQKFSDLIDWASKSYDLIIIDTPPVLAVTDAVIIGRYAGTTLLVARFESNTIKEIDVSVRRLVQSGVNVKGCIVNGIVKKASNYYGYGYSHYGYSYSDNK